MLGRYLARFQQLSPEAVGLVWQRTTARRPEINGRPAPTDGAQLHTILQEAGVFQAEVVMAIARDTGPVAEQAIEALVGRPITRRHPGDPPPTVQPQRRQAHRAQRSDPRTIHLRVMSCPKKPGTGAWDLWQLYRDGMTVDEFMQAGGTRAAVKYDSDHGFIELRGPE